MDRPVETDRRSIRLAGYDYRQFGAYFVTICAWQRRSAFGVVAEGQFCLGPWGRIVAEEWSEIRNRRPNVGLDEFVVMPNHLHGILVVNAAPRLRLPARHFGSPEPDSLGAIIGAFKAGVARRITRLEGAGARLVWQRNYFERIIRSDAELEKFRAYIADNPRRWECDPENPGRGKSGPLQPG